MQLKWMKSLTLFHSSVEETKRCYIFFMAVFTCRMCYLSLVNKLGVGWQRPSSGLAFQHKDVPGELWRHPSVLFSLSFSFFFCTLVISTHPFLATLSEKRRCHGYPPREGSASCLRGNQAGRGCCLSPCDSSANVCWVWFSLLMEHLALHRRRRSGPMNVWCRALGGAALGFCLVTLGRFDWVTRCLDVSRSRGRHTVFQ